MLVVIFVDKSESKLQVRNYVNIPDKYPKNSKVLGGDEITRMFMDGHINAIHSS